jgi:uncharacterized coiled-coil protein SlyX
MAYMVDNQLKRVQYFCLRMSVHIGREIQKRAKELRVGPTELGRRISKTKSNVRDIFERDSVDTALLELISKALNYNFFVFYNVDEHENNYVTNLESQIASKDLELSKLEMLASSQKKTIELLEEKMKRLEDQLANVKMK